MRRIVLTAFTVVMASPAAGAAQDASRWFWDVGLGWSSPVEAHSAFEGGAGLRLGIGRMLRPDLGLRLSYGWERLPYDDARFGELFDTPGAPDAAPLGTTVRHFATGLEWSPAVFGRIRPTLGGSLAYEHRSVSGLVTSSAWYYCSTGTRFVYGTDPVSGRTTLATENPTPAPGCTALRNDIDIEGGTLTMATSLGVSIDMGAGSLGMSVEYSHGLTATLPGLASTHVLWRMPF